MGLRGTMRLLLSPCFQQGGDCDESICIGGTDDRNCIDSANASRFLAPPGIPECRDDARKLCSAVLFDLDKRRACMSAQRSQLSQACIAAIRASH